MVVPGVKWVIGDGRSARFWQDKWLLNEPLKEILMTDLPNEVVELKVCDYWGNGTGWLTGRIEPFLPAVTLLQLRALVIDNVTGCKDRISWGERSDGQFTVSSAYELCTRNDIPRPDLGNLFQRVWKVVAQSAFESFYG